MPDALDYISHPAKYPAKGVIALYGDEAFLKRQSLARLREEVLGSGDADFSLAEFSGETAQLREVMDELSTVAMFGGGQRLVVIAEADDFVSRYRSELEDYVAKPKATAVFVLEVSTWPSNTRLAKAVVERGLPIECKCPPPAKLLKWLSSWAKHQHQSHLDPAATELLLEIVEPELGLLDQELAKLAALAGPNGTITVDMVHEAVGGWRTKTTWDMLDAAVAGDARALTQLDHLLLSGEVPVALLGQVSASLRRFAAATRLVEQAEAAGRRISLRQALEEAGIKAFVLSKAEAQLRQIGRAARGARLYRWLLEADLA